jgi:mono/diheme cytochrome c family protein
MTVKFVTFAIVLTVALPALILAAQDKPKTTWDGVYSEGQAKRGETTYSKTCASCHGPDLSGADTAPSLTGAGFNSDWSDLTIDDLASRIRTTMPADGPGTVGPEDVADIVAFILSKDGFPAGPVELTSQTEGQKAIKFVVQKP